MTHSMLAGADVIVNGARLSGMAVWMENGQILAVGPDQPMARGRMALPGDALLAPGFVDVQVNGGGGVLFNDTPDAATALAMAAAHRRLGTTSILPTVITDTPDVMRRAGEAACAASAIANGGVRGVHVEGPFLSMARPGVHQPALIRPPAEADLCWLESLAACLPVLLTVAPETMPDGALARLAAAGIVLSAGHSAATLDAVIAARGQGLRGFTHVFNAMAPDAARAPGIIAAALLSDDMFCGVIADLIHVHPAMLALLLRCKAPDRVMLVSDAMAVAGTDMTAFRLQGRRIHRREGRLVTDDGTLAGADLSLVQAVRNMAALPGMDLARAIGMASAVPAAFMGLGHDVGAIAPGLRADMVLLGPALEVLGTWVGGQFAPGQDA